ncbi:MAG: hypothetical protein JW702_05250 [Clostridiales bacterium]|nr:hypothetical protein [Clostridiales bacterium]
MKIKLNISKELKRNLKIKASEKELDRNDYIYEIIENFLNEKESIWGPKIEHILELAYVDEISIEEKARVAMKKTTRKLQPLILNVNEKTFFALAIVAKKSKKTKEEMLVNLLTNVVKEESVQ